MPLQKFVLDGFQTQALLFALFLALYVVAILGNLTMIMIITLDASLHSPMYFFLKNLSFVDLCYSSVIYPKALANFLSSSKVPRDPGGGSGKLQPHPLSAQPSERGPSLT